MKKILPLALLMCILTMVSVWSIGWFMQASQIKKDIERDLAAFDPALGTLKVERIETSGFPGKMIVTLTNPSIMLRVKAAAASLHKHTMATVGNSAGVLTTPEYPDTTMDYALRGTVAFSMNALSDRFEFSIQGADHMRFSQGAASVAFGTEYNGPSACDIQLQRDPMNLLRSMWNMERFFKGGLKQRLREVNCRVAGSITTQEGTQQIISSMSPAEFLLSTKSEQGRVGGALRLQIQGYEVMPTGDAIYNQIRPMLLPAGRNYAPLALSLHGKQTLTLDLTFDVPEGGSANAQAPFRIDVKQLYFSSAAATTNGALLIASSPQGNQKQGELSFNIISEFTPKQTEVAKASIGQIIQEARENEQLTALIQNIDQKTLEALIFEGLPDISTMGKITQKLHATFSADATKKEGSLNLSALEFSTRDYGITASGQGNITPNAPFPEVNATLLCRNCLAMVETMSAYLARVDKVASALSPENAGQIALEPSDIAGVKSLLSAVGAPIPTAPNDLQFVIKSNTGAVDVNGKSLAELMGLMQQYLGPKESPAP